uniref:Uncharacterized protein n=1 Tax=Romanomermis culicivorax TaxID=13658 RepID=A0A915IF79_ROMCU
MFAEATHSATETWWQLIPDHPIWRGIQDAATNPVKQKHIGGQIYKPYLKYQWNSIKSLIIFALDKSK